MTALSKGVGKSLLQQTREDVKQIGEAIEKRISQKKISSAEKEELIQELMGVISLLEKVEKPT